MKYLILSLVMTLFSTCKQNTNPESKWQVWETETLKHNQLSFDEIIVLSPKEALLFGDEDTPENFQKMQEQQNLYLTRFAVIYNSKDGGKTWQKETFEKGGFWHTCQAGDTLYATKVVNNGRLAEKTSILYRSTDKGETWEVINEFIGEAVFLALDEQANGYIGGLKEDSTQRNPQVYEIESGQLKEQEERISYPAKWKPETKEILYTKQSESSDINDLFCVFDTETKQLKEYELPKGVHGYFADKSEGQYWVIGNKDDKCYLYKKAPNTDFELVYKFELNENTFPKGLKIFGKEMVAVIGIVKSSWTENSTFFSSDGGKTWHEEKLPKPQYFNPVDFIQTEEGIFGMAYSGSGRVQVRK